MSRRLALAILVASATAHADAPPDVSDIGEQGIGAELGIATGGRVTAGGLRAAGHYLYQLSDQDWFDGIAAFTFGGGAAACFRDRDNAFVCDHGLLQGGSVEVSANVRRYFGGQDQFLPFARAGVGLSIVRFSSDSVTGLGIPLHLGGGVRATVSDGIAIVGEGELAIGFGVFNHSLGLEPQVGVAITAGAEFRL
jgi:opacity protein-like surface antigen